jgi:hypothetical protein
MLRRGLGKKFDIEISTLEVPRRICAFLVAPNYRYVLLFLISHYSKKNICGISSSYLVKNN